MRRLPFGIAIATFLVDPRACFAAPKATILRSSSAPHSLTANIHPHPNDGFASAVRAVVQVFANTHLSAGAIALLVAGVAGLSTVLLAILKAVLLDPYLEHRKVEIEREWRYRVYSRQTADAAVDLCGRLEEIRRNWPPTYFCDPYILTRDAPVVVTYNHDDLHDQQAKVTSTLYRLCAILGWLELYRQQLAYPDLRFWKKRDRRLNRIRRLIESALADSQPRNIKCRNCKDPLIFREEQHAIAQMMLVREGDQSRVIGYHQFVSWLNHPEAVDQRRWIAIVANMFGGAQAKEHDFRPYRCDMLKVHLVDLVRELRGQSTPKVFKKWRKEALERLQEVGIDEKKMYRCVVFGAWPEYEEHAAECVQENTRPTTTDSNHHSLSEDN